jgi:hypothetical protein
MEEEPAIGRHDPLGEIKMEPVRTVFATFTVPAYCGNGATSARLGMPLRQLSIGSLAGVFEMVLQLSRQTA